MENSRIMLGVCNQLYSIGLANKVTLPKIVLVGDQSTGKSSVIESISGINLPRGTGMVTRCPIIVSMLHRTDPRILFEGEEVLNEDLCRLVLEKQNEYAGANKNVADKPIHIERHSPTVFDLTIIDLPGMIKNRSEGQPEDIEEQVENLVKEYIKDENCIILVVIPANNDIQTVGAIKFAKKFDPEGIRTIGVMTKADRCQDRDDIISVLEMREVKMRLGIFATRNRNPEEIKSSLPLSEARDIEKRFFQRKFPKHLDRCGIENLARVLSLLLTERMKKSFPHLEAEIKKKLNETRDELMKLGTPVPKSDSEKRTLMSVIAKRISDGVEDRLMIGGNGDLRNFFVGEKKTVGMIDSVYKRFGNCVRKEEPKFMADGWNKTIMKLVKDNSSGKLAGFKDYGVFCHVIRDQIKKFQEHAMEALDDAFTALRVTVEKEVLNRCEKFKGLAAFFSQNTKDLLLKCRKETEWMICKIFEKEKYIFTNNHYYVNNLKKLREQDIIRQMISQKTTVQTQGKETSFGSNSYKRGKVVDVVQPDKFVIKRSNLEDVVVETQMSLTSYHKVVMKRVMDAIPMEIQFTLIEQLKSKIFETLNRLVQEDKEITRCINENYTVKMKRKELKEDDRKYHEGLDVLRKAKFYL